MIVTNLFLDDQFYDTISGAVSNPPEGGAGAAGVTLEEENRQREEWENELIKVRHVSNYILFKTFL